MDNQQERAQCVLRSAIQTGLLNRALKKGSWLAGSGALLIILCGTFLPLSIISILGIPIFITGITLIGIGLLPYKKLCRLQLKPHEIHINATELLFLQMGKPLFKVAIRSIEKLAFLRKENIYGIGLWLKRPLEERVKVLQPHFNFAAFMADSLERFDGCDLFLPYFTDASCRETIDLLELDRAS